MGFNLVYNNPIIIEFRHHDVPNMVTSGIPVIVRVGVFKRFTFA